MSFTNYELELMLNNLQPVLKLRTTAGYKAAINARRIGEAITEYTQVKNSLIDEFGEETDGGKMVSPDASNFAEFLAKFNEIALIEQDIDLLKASKEEVEGVLSGEEILACDWFIDFED